MDWSGFTTRAAAESWYPQNAYGNTSYNTKTANFNGRSGKLVIRDDKKRMDAFLNFRTSNGHKRIMKVSFLPNGEVHVDLVAVGGYKSPGGAVYKCSNWYKNKIISASGTNYNSNSQVYSQTTSNRMPDTAICNLATEGYSNKSWRTYNHSKEYVEEAKRRGLSCGVKTDQEKKKNSANLTNEQLCKNATYGGRWELALGYLHFVQEAKRRGLSCGVKNDEAEKQVNDRQLCIKATRLILGKIRWDPKLGNDKYVEEAKRRGLSCGVEDDEAEKQRLAEEKARQERIKAEQDKIKKEEEFRKKKIAEAKARQQKIAEEKAREKKQAEEEARKKRLAEEERKRKIAEAKLNQQIADNKRKAANFYKDIENYVKSGGNVDLVKLSDFFDVKPNPKDNWNQSDLSRYEKLREFMISIPQFVSYEKERIGERLKNSFAMKDQSIAQLEKNLSELKGLMRKMFGSSEVPKIKDMIKDIQSTLSNFNQSAANKVISQSSTYIASKSPKPKEEKRITKVASSFDKNWSNVEDDLTIQQQQFCQLTDRFYNDLNRARVSKNEIKVNMVHKERQENLDALIPRGKINNWIFKVVKIDQVEDGSAAVVLGLQCRSFVGSGQTIDIKRGMNSTDKKEWRATIPYNDRRFRELAKLDQGQFIVGSGTMLEINAYRPGQKETFYASQQIGEHPLTKGLNLEGELFIADLSYIAALN